MTKELNKAFYFAHNKNRTDDFGRFQAISPLKTNTNQLETDLIEAMASVSPAAQVLFVQLKRNHDYVLGVCTYPKTRLQDNKSSAYKLFSRHIVSLTKSKLIKRLPTKVIQELQLTGDCYHYMVNPYLVKCKEYDQACKVWRRITA